MNHQHYTPKEQAGFRLKHARDQLAQHEEALRRAEARRQTLKCKRDELSEQVRRFYENNRRYFNRAPIGKIPLVTGQRAAAYGRPRVGDWNLNGERGTIIALDVIDNQVMIKFDSGGPTLWFHRKQINRLRKVPKGRAENKNRGKLLREVNMDFRETCEIVFYHRRTINRIKQSIQRLEREAA